MKKRICISLTALLGAMILGTGSAYAVTPGTNIYQIPTTQKVVALTFDDAWNPVYMTAILDALREADVKATFFPTGGGVTYGADLALQALAEGHVIGNHSYAHENMPSLTSAAMLESIQKTERANALIGARGPTPLFRAPFGNWTTTLLTVLKGQGYANVLWSLNANDATLSVSECIYRVVNYTSEGEIILFHTQNPTAPAALPEIIRQLKARGYTFVTLRDAICETWQNTPRYEQSNPSFIYEGTWTTGWSTASLAGNWISTGTPGDKVTVNFEGTYLQWIARTTPWYGKALVTLDGGEPVIANCHYSAGVSRWAVYSTGIIPDGSHTVTIECIDDGIDGPGISVDALYILGTVTP